MKLLVDANLPPTLVPLLVSGSIDAIHVQDVGLLRASDEEILDHAGANELVVLTADTDFPMLLSLRRATLPSVLLLRGVNEMAAGDVAALVLANLDAVASQLGDGAVVSLSPTSLRWRQLPLR